MNTKEKYLWIAILLLLIIPICVSAGNPVSLTLNDNERISIDHESAIYEYYIDADNLFHYGYLTVTIHFKDGTECLNYQRERYKPLDGRERWRGISKGIIRIPAGATEITYKHFDKIRPMERMMFKAKDDEGWHYSEYIYPIDYVNEEDKQYANNLYYGHETETRVQKFDEGSGILYYIASDNLYIETNFSYNLSIYNIDGSLAFLSIPQKSSHCIPLSKTGRGLKILKFWNTACEQSLKINIK